MAIDFPANLPRAPAVAPFIDDPLAAFQRGRERWGDVFLLAEGRPLFSGAEDCAGCIAAFGEANMRRVFLDLEHFGMPVSLARQHSFPPTLAKLNSGLFSMTGEEHRTHQRLLADLLDASAVESSHQAILAGCRAFLDTWEGAAVIPLLSEMRRLTLEISARVIFGGEPADAIGLGALVQSYFATRRDYTTNPQAPADQRRHLIELGHRLDHDLRALARRMGSATDDDDSVFARLVRARTADGNRLDEQQLITHANVLFMSGSEPTAVTLTWCLLLLSQTPDLRSALREQIERVCGTSSMPTPGQLCELTLVDRVVKETLRVLPPNAIMIRLTRGACDLGGFRLPERCEILLSPFVAHRDPQRFPRPDEFDPSRWDGLSPRPFEYLPFGNGQRYCMGRNLAAHTLSVALTAILQRYDWTLDQDQDIDWTINVNLMPASEPLLRIGTRSPGGGGRLGGPVSRLFCFPH